MEQIDTQIGLIQGRPQLTTAIDEQVGDVPAKRRKGRGNGKSCNQESDVIGDDSRHKRKKRRG